MTLCILVRHAESLYNVEHRVNGDPAIPVALSDHGRAEAAQLALHIAQLRIEVCVHTRFLRTIETATLGLGDRAGEVPFVCEPLLDDIDAGALEGRPMADLAAWSDSHSPDDPFPGGESWHDAARRFARGFRHLAARPEGVMLVVCHEFPIRFVLNAAAGSSDLQRPEHQIANATPYLFEAAALDHGATMIERRLGGR